MINKREIKIWGIDMHLGEYDINAAQSILDNYSVDTLKIDCRKLNKLYNERLVYHKEGTVSETEQYELMQMINTISNYTQYLISKKGANTDLSAILQWIRNINTAFSYTKHNYTEQINPEALSLIFRNRDSQMSENILWMVDHFPNEKFIIWCANFHGAKDISQTKYPTDSLLYFTFQSMGESLSYKLENKLYSLAFTSLNNGQDAGTLEKEISVSSQNTPFAFINFEPLRFEDGYRDKMFDSSLIMKKEGKWLYMFDGVYFIRDQKTNYAKEYR